MTVVRLSRRARDWLEREGHYLAERDPAAATRFVARMQDARALLAEFPNAGSPGLVPGTRQLVVGAYVLTYRRNRGAVEIAAIRHGRQRDARFADEAGGPT